MKKYLSFVLLNITIAVLHPAQIQAQDPHFSQFYSNTIYTNPAFAGASGYTRFSMNTRRQYSNIPNSTYTSTVSADMNIKRTNGSLGMICLFDRTGSSAYTTMDVSMIYSYRIVYNRKISINAAIQGGMVSRSVDRNKLVFADQLDTELGKVRDTKENIVYNQRYYPNFSTGILISGKHFFSGIAIHNLAEPNQSFINSNSRSKSLLQLRRYTFHTGMNLYTSRSIRKAVIISPNILLMSQGRANELNLGFYAKKSNLTTGVWLRQTMNNTDAMIFLIGYKYESMTFGYSYDMGMGPYAANMKSAHEISLQFELKKKRDYQKHVVWRIPCPSL